MDDFMARQVQHTIAEYHRMLTRVAGSAVTTLPRVRRQGVRAAVATALVMLATRLAPSRVPQRTAS
jgi:hypothetical protein